jgi:protein-S-isoprenylcysteine O-methyltransferase Ste14
MELIGKTTIHPVLFFSGKISGYFTWSVMVLSLLNIEILAKHKFPFSKEIYILTLVIGLLFIVVSLVNLGKSTRLGLPDENTVFKTNGLYKISRNPMYVGFNLLTVSSIIYCANIWILLLGIYSIIVYHLIIRGEETFLKKRFGETYINYIASVRRYI